MNECNEKFLKDNNMFFAGLSAESVLKDAFDINPITARYEVLGRGMSKNVSVANIYGINRRMSSIPGRFPEILDAFFNRGGDNYHSRSVTMLDYNENNVIEGLNRSFFREPIILMESDKEQYLVLTNGMHRFVVLRSLYLSAKSKCKSLEEIDALNQRFIIPVKVVPIDLTKSYCKYLIDLFQPASCMGEYIDQINEFKDENGTQMYQLDKSVGYGRVVSKCITSEEMDDYIQSYTDLGVEYDEEYKPTGRCKLQKFNGEIEFLNDEELIDMTRQIIIDSKKNTSELINRLKEQASEYESFNEFLQKYFGDILDIEKREDLHDNVKRKENQ